jgi:predicted RNA-binding protein YlqC (UPF0109 family)
MAPQFRQFVEYVAQTLAEQPERVQVEELPAPADGQDGAAGPRLRLTVAPDDVGRIVGRRGRTAKAIRTVLAAAGDCELEIAGSAEQRDDDEDELNDD